MLALLLYLHDLAARNLTVAAKCLEEVQRQEQVQQQALGRFCLMST